MTILFVLVLLIVLVAASVPSWPYSRNWGFYASGAFATVFAVLLLLVLLGQVSVA